MSLEIIDYPLEYFSFEATNEILRSAVQWRKLRGYTLKGTAILLGIPVRTFYNWNSGMVRYLRPDYFNALFEHITTCDKPAYRAATYQYKQNHPNEVPSSSPIQHLTQANIDEMYVEQLRGGLPPY